MEGWGPVKKIAKFVGMSEGTVRGWLKHDGLKHSRLKTGTILIKYADADKFLKSFQVDDSEADRIDRIVDGVMRDFDLK